ncbi:MULTISPECIES: transporter substrate-binding domain-containing protein [Enterobacterales]|uniref:ATP-binding protein n=1 Tax=Enterobacterales TaxID=91347 RepID=UPI001CB97077|nr:MULTISPECIES: transporter substrate-binding domain-containing protein [Enterobacterales]
MNAFLKAALVLIVLCVGGLQNASSAQLLQIYSRENYRPRDFYLEDSAWRWLGEKRVLNVAVWQPSISPLDMFTDEGVYEGITADYIWLISQYLGLRVVVHEYANRDEAVAALKNRSVDLLVDPTGKMLPIGNDNGLIATDRIISDNPVLVSARKHGEEVFHYTEGMQLAVSRWYTDYHWLEQRFPHVRIVDFNSDDEALASVAFGNSDFYIGSLVASTYQLDRNYGPYLEVKESYSERDTGGRFVLRQDNTVLLESINRVLAAIPDTQHQLILQQWGERADLWRVGKKISFTSIEQKWLANNAVVKVSVNKFYAPFTVIDDQGHFFGVTADVLRLLQLRTGLRFQSVPAYSVDEMSEEVHQHDAMFMGAISESEERSKNLLFSRPYFSSPFVMVVSAVRGTNVAIAAGNKIAIVKGNALKQTLRSSYPGVQIIEAPNANIAMQWVVEGKVEAAVNNLFSTTYMIDHYFKGQLVIVGQVGQKSAAIRFAVSRDQPELLSILNKGLESISPNNMAVILSKWQTRPDVKLNTWDIYRTQFLLLAGGAAVVTFMSFLWIFYLRREATARKQAKKNLQAQLRFNETLLNSIPIPLYVVDRHGEMVMSNHAWGAFFKINQRDKLNKGIQHADNPLHEVWKWLTPLLGGDEHHNKSDTRTVRLFDGEDEHTIVHYAMTYSRSGAHIEGLICTWMDITEHETLAAALSEAREHAEQANRAKSTFLATMSHEIRTPVSAIIGLLELAVKTSDSQDSDDPVRVAWSSAKTLMGIIGDILDMARIESGRLELSPEWVRTTELLTPVVRIFEGLARQKNLRLRCSLPAVLPYEVFIDPLRIRQVISNLVGNAVKFTEKGGVDIDMDLLPGAESEHALLKISVQDTGKGISPLELKDIFEPWVQAQNGAIQGGSGLGLAICAQLIQMMGGEISMTSQLDQGTKVTFTVPVEQNMARPLLQPTPEMEPSRNLVALRILAVDDHPANRLLLKRQLALLGHQVTEARDGNEGWSLWQSELYEIVITDCSMPGMDGLALTRLIREHQTKPTIILGLTANAWPEERLRCQEAGMDDCLFKPLQLQQLQKILEDAAQRLYPHPMVEVSLENYLNYEGLRNLTQHDEQLMRELLDTTLNSNADDLCTAQECVEREDWRELAVCIHRISGATQIIGANVSAQYCMNLESLCNQDAPSRSEIMQAWEETKIHLDTLNQVIQNWLQVSKKVS